MAVKSQTNAQDTGVKTGLPKEFGGPADQLRRSVR